MIKFQKFYVTNGQEKAKVWYSLGAQINGRKCVTLYAKDYVRTLGRIFPDNYSNGTDISTDYFERGTVRIFEDNPLYEAARARAEENEEARREKYLAKQKEFT